MPKPVWFIRGVAPDVVQRVNAAAKADRRTVGEWLTLALQTVLDRDTTGDAGVAAPDMTERLVAVERANRDILQRLDELAARLDRVDATRTGERDAPKAAAANGADPRQLDIEHAIATANDGIDMDDAVPALLKPAAADAQTGAALAPPSDTDSDLLDRLRAAINSHVWLQKEVAAETGIDATAFSRIVRHGKRLTPDKRARIAAWLARREGTAGKVPSSDV